MADMISECCEDCISWNGRCLEGIDFEELADNGDCYAYEPRSFYFDMKKEQAEKARREQKEIDEMEAIAEDLIKHPVHQSFSTVKGKSFRLVNLMPGALPDEGPLSYGVKNGQVFSREELNRKLSWYRMQKKWYEIEYQDQSACHNYRSGCGPAYSQRAAPGIIAAERGYGAYNKAEDRGLDDAVCDVVGVEVKSQPLQIVGHLNHSGQGDDQIASEEPHDKTHERQQRVEEGRCKDLGHY